MSLKILNNHVLSFVLDPLCKSFIGFKDIHKAAVKIPIFLMEKLKLGGIKKLPEGHTVSNVTQSPWFSHRPRKHQKGALTDIVEESLLETGELGSESQQAELAKKQKQKHQHPKAWVPAGFIRSSEV